jgi:hypothetical protein
MLGFWSVPRAGADTINAAAATLRSIRFKFDVCLPTQPKLFSQRAAEVRFSAS